MSIARGGLAVAFTGENARGQADQTYQPKRKDKWKALLDLGSPRPRDLPDKVGMHVAVVCDSSGKPKGPPVEPANIRMSAGQNAV